MERFAGNAGIAALIDQQTDPEHPRFVPLAERVVAIDNDGTLWCEKPMYVQVDFVVRRWKEMLIAEPGLAAAQPYKALAEQDLACTTQSKHLRPGTSCGNPFRWSG